MLSRLPPALHFVGDESCNLYLSFEEMLPEFGALKLPLTYLRWRPFSQVVWWRFELPGPPTSRHLAGLPGDTHFYRSAEQGISKAAAHGGIPLTQLGKSI